MNWPEVTVTVMTYNRRYEIFRRVEALVEHLHYPNLRWLVSDDCSPNGYVDNLRQHPLFRKLNAEIISTPKNGGWGRNGNNILTHCVTDYQFFLEDDKELHKDLDLRLGIALMETHPDVGMVRYKGTAGTHVVLHQFEADISQWLPDHQDGGCGLPGKLSYLQIDGASPTLYIYSHGPHLKHHRFHDFYGAYPEGLKLASTEESYEHMVKDKMLEPGAPGIAILPEWVLPWFEDFGQSWQNSEWDK